MDDKDKNVENAREDSVEVLKDEMLTWYSSLDDVAKQIEAVGNFGNQSVNITCKYWVNELRTIAGSIRYIESLSTF